MPMQCIACDADFLSLKWYAEDIKDPVCDRCLLMILKTRKLIKLNEVASIERHIKNLEDSLQ